MKNKILLIVVFAILGTMPFYGQKKLMVGVTTGLTVSTLSESGNIYNNEALKTGFGGGISFKYRLSNSFGLQSGVLYEQKGFRKKHEMISGEEKITGMYNYVTIPLLAEGSLPLKGNARLYGLAGFYAGFKTYSENALVLSGENLDTQTMSNNIKSTDEGWVIGGGVQVPAGDHIMQIGFRYSQGLAEVLSTSSKDRNKSALFGVALFF